MNIGDPVRVGHHWLRGKHEGTLLAYDTADDLWVVGFTRRWVGGGYDDAAFPGVQCLRLAENQLAPLEASPQPGPRRTKRSRPSAHNGSNMVVSTIQTKSEANIQSKATRVASG
jgi:hypothetical protein